MEEITVREIIIRWVEYYNLDTKKSRFSVLGKEFKNMSVFRILKELKKNSAVGKRFIFAITKYMLTMIS
jgi:hypothetical protein